MFSFVDLKNDGQMLLHSLVVVLNDTFELDLAKSVRLVKITEPIDIARQQGLAETPVREQPGCGLHLHTGAQAFLIEVLVADNRHFQ